MTKETILIIEDEDDIAYLIAHHMEAAGFNAVIAHDGRTALRRIEKELPELIILDLMLPDMDGTKVCKALRQEEKTRSIPIVMVTAKGEEIDRILGLELGADDYVVKPFSPRELSLRVKAILKRLKGAPRKQKVLKYGTLVLDTDAHAVTLEGERIELTFTEFKLLAELLENKGRIRSRDTLLDNVWGYTFEGYHRTVDTHIQRLRRKLGNQGKIIETVRGIGYMIQ